MYIPYVLTMAHMVPLFPRRRGSWILTAQLHMLYLVKSSFLWGRIQRSLGRFGISSLLPSSCTKWSKWSKCWNMFGVSGIPQLNIFLKSFKKEWIPMMGLLLLFYECLWQWSSALILMTLCIFMLFQGPRVYQPHWFIAAQQPLKVGSSIRQTQHTQLAEGWPSGYIPNGVRNRGEYQTIRVEPGIRPGRAQSNWTTGALSP